MQKLLPDICQLSEFNMFQQDDASTHCEHETVDMLTRETPDFIPPCFSHQALNLVDYKVWSVMQEKVNKGRIKKVDDLHLPMLTTQINWISTLLIRQLGSGARVCACVKGSRGHREHKLSQ